MMRSPVFARAATCAMGLLGVLSCTPRSRVDETAAPHEDGAAVAASDPGSTTRGGASPDPRPAAEATAPAESEPPLRTLEQLRTPAVTPQVAIVDHASDSGPTPGGESHVFVVAGGCEFHVSMYGAPAVSRDGAYVVHQEVDDYRDWHEESDNDEHLYVEHPVWVQRVDGTESPTKLRVLATDRAAPRRGQALRCAKLRPLLERRIAEINAKLAEHEWRAMSKPKDLGVELVPPGESPRGAEGAFELYTIERQIVFRRGEEDVFQTEAPWCAGPDCYGDRQEFRRAFIDLPTGLVMVGLWSFGSDGSETTEHARFVLGEPAREALTEHARRQPPPR